MLKDQCDYNEKCVQNFVRKAGREDTTREISP